MSNSLAEVHPELVSEWSEKNLTLTPDDITFGSNTYEQFMMLGDAELSRRFSMQDEVEQKEEVKKALAAGVPKATILTYFYPEVSVERMSSYRKKH